MRGLTRIICIIIFIFTFIAPTSAFASTSNTQSSSNSGFFQTISNLFSYFTKDTSSTSYQTDIKNQLNTYDTKRDWWDCLNWSDWWKWWCNGGDHDDGSDDECHDNKYGWSNDDRCVDSAEIWKRWYCH